MMTELMTKRFPSLFRIQLVQLHLSVSKSEFAILAAMDLDTIGTAASS